jgi:hypothetical protein
MSQPIHVVASFLVADLCRAVPGLDAGSRGDLAVRIETALRAVLGEEREACAALCEARRALWQATEEKPGSPASLRAEARARANEAAVLADAIRAR